MNKRILGQYQCFIDSCFLVQQHVNILFRMWDVCIKHLVWHAARTVTQVSCLFRSFHDHYQYYSS